MNSANFRVVGLAMIALLHAANGASGQPPFPMPKPPVPAGAAVITIGTPWTVVETVLGTPKFSSTIPCLGRGKLVYDDGTEILLLNSCVISATPGGAAQGDPVNGFMILRPGCSIYFEPAVLRASVNCFDPELKMQVERCYHYAPPLPDGYPRPQPPMHIRWPDDHHHHEPAVGPRVRLY